MCEADHGGCGLEEARHKSPAQGPLHHALVYPREQVVGKHSCRQAFLLKLFDMGVQLAHVIACRKHTQLSLAMP